MDGYVDDGRVDGWTGSTPTCNTNSSVTSALPYQVEYVPSTRPHQILWLTLFGQGLTDTFTLDVGYLRLREFQFFLKNLSGEPAIVLRRPLSRRPPSVHIQWSLLSPHPALTPVSISPGNNVLTWPLEPAPTWLLPSSLLDRHPPNFESFSPPLLFLNTGRPSTAPLPAPCPAP